jgi:hypothetical protein
VASDPAADAAPVAGPGVAKTGNAIAFEVPPPGAGLTPVIWAVPEEAISAAEIAAAPPVVPTNKVVRPLPFHSSTEQGVQPVPFIPNKKAGFPAVASIGMSVAIDGVGREPGAANVKVEVLDVVVELETVTPAIPWNAVSADDSATVSCVTLTKVVGRGDPFQLTTKPFTKFVPFTVNVRPETPQEGAVFVEVVDAESEVMVGATIGNAAAAEVPPPPPVVGLNTVI